jgi:hypothetical protein
MVRRGGRCQPLSAMAGVKHPQRFNSVLLHPNKKQIWATCYDSKTQFNGHPNNNIRIVTISIPWLLWYSTQFNSSPSNI